MSERLEAETQIAAPEAVKGLDEFDSLVGASRLTPSVVALIDRMMDGSEPMGRELRTNEFLKFNATHINICALRAAGFKGVEIAKMMDRDYNNVWVTLHHPYGKKLVRALVETNAGKVIDIRTRLDEYAGELLDHTFSLAMQNNDTAEVSAVTFGLLDRAGYGVKSGQGSNEKPQQVFDQSTLSRLASAMEGSNSIDQHVMRGYVPRRPPEEGALPESEAVGSSEDTATGSAPVVVSQVVAPRRVG